MKYYAKTNVYNQVKKYSHLLLNSLSLEYTSISYRRQARETRCKQIRWMLSVISLRPS